MQKHHSHGTPHKQKVSLCTVNQMHLERKRVRKRESNQDAGNLTERAASVFIRKPSLQKSELARFGGALETALTSVQCGQARHWPLSDICTSVPAVQSSPVNQRSLRNFTTSYFLFLTWHCVTSLRQLQYVVTQHSSHYIITCSDNFYIPQMKARQSTFCS